MTIIDPLIRKKGICPYCSVKMKKWDHHTESGIGCIITILGLVLTPVLLGIPIIIYGLWKMNLHYRYWICKRCGSKFARAR